MTWCRTQHCYVDVHAHALACETSQNTRRRSVYVRGRDTTRPACMTRTALPLMGQQWSRKTVRSTLVCFDVSARVARLTCPAMDCLTMGRDHHHGGILRLAKTLISHSELELTMSNRYNTAWGSVGTTSNCALKSARVSFSVKS